MRVYDLARELGHESRAVVATAKMLGLDIDHASDALTKDEQTALRGALAAPSPSGFAVPSDSAPAAAAGADTPPDAARYVLVRKASLHGAGGATLIGERIDADTWAALPAWAQDYFDTDSTVAGTIDTAAADPAPVHP